MSSSCSSIVFFCSAVVRAYPSAGCSSRSLPCYLVSLLKPSYDWPLARCVALREPTDPTPIEDSVQMYLGSENSVVSWITSSVFSGASVWSLFGQIR